MCGPTGRLFLGMVLFAASALASGITGIWVGQSQNQRGEPDDVAFRFRLEGPSLTGTLFGDEFDIQISDGSVSGDQVRFTVVTTNYYSKRKLRFLYTGTINGTEMELVRERLLSPEDKTPSARPQGKQTLKLKKLI